MYSCSAKSEAASAGYVVTVPDRKTLDRTVIIIRSGNKMQLRTEKYDVRKVASHEHDEEQELSSS